MDPYGSIWIHRIHMDPYGSYGSICDKGTRKVEDADVEEDVWHIPVSKDDGSFEFLMGL